MERGKQAMTYVFSPAEIASVPVAESDKLFPIHRIFCVGRNYAAHAAEMGGEVDREAPWYFTKSPASYGASGQTFPYPPGTQDYHHEVELIVALNGSAFRVSKEQADAVIFGYACGLDMTRRDLQQVGKDNRRPWDLGKDVENAAIIGPITPKADFGAPGAQTITLSVNGSQRQKGSLADMVWTVPEIISHLSHYYHLRAGDVIMTGTPSGVGPVKPGDVLHGEIDGLLPVTLTIGSPEE